MEEPKKKCLAVRNMPKYQHYKKDKPSWIKLYRSLWGEREFSMLPDATKAHIIGLFSLCSQHSNLLPFETEEDRKWIAEELKARGDIDWEAIVNSEFVVIIESPVYKSSRDRIERLYSQKRREEKRREEKRNISASETIPEQADGSGNQKLLDVITKSQSVTGKHADIDAQLMEQAPSPIHLENISADLKGTGTVLI